MPKAFLVDVTRCTACRGCQMACKIWHNLPAVKTFQTGTHQNPPDLTPCNLKIVRFSERLDDNGVVHWNFFPDQCRHCLKPICVEVANAAVPGAMVKDEKTGAVLVTEKCRQLTQKDAEAVIHACPYDIPRYDAEKKMLMKCDMCIDRISAGIPPMCVKTCPTGTMLFGERDDVIKEAQRRLEKVKLRFPQARIIDMPIVSVLYLVAEDPKYYHEHASFA